MKKLLFVFNPLAGKGQIKNELFNIVDIFTKEGFDVTVYPTQCSGDGERKIREDANKYDLILASGGDGIKADVSIAEMMGSEYQTHIKVNGKDVIIRVPTIGIDGALEEKILKGGQVSFTFKPEVMHLFDKESEKNLLY